MALIACHDPEATVDCDDSEEEEEQEDAIGADGWRELMDGKIKKRVLKEGHGVQPEMNQDVICSVKISVAAEGCSAGEFCMQWPERRYRIGEGEAFPALELTLRYMIEGEECEAFGTTNMAWGPHVLKAISVDEKEFPADADVHFHVILHSILPFPPGELSWNDKIQQCNWRKTNGNDHFKRKQLRLATKCYSHGIELFGGSFEPPEHFVGGREAAIESACSATADCANNLAAVHLEQGNYTAARDAAGAALEVRPDNVKALYRYAKANLGLCNHDECEHALKRALCLDANNLSIMALFMELEREKKTYTNKSKNMAAKLFQGDVDWARESRVGAKQVSKEKSEWEKEEDEKKREELEGELDVEEKKESLLTTAMLFGIFLGLFAPMCFLLPERRGWIAIFVIPLFLVAALINKYGVPALDSGQI